MGTPTYRRIYSSNADSAQLARCSLAAHLAWAHMAYVVDYYGRCSADPGYIRYTMLKRRIDVTPKCIASWIGEWEREGLIITYVVDGMRLLQVLTFDRYQPDAIKHRREKDIHESLPAPPGYVAPAPVPGRPRNSERNSERNSGRNSKETRRKLGVKLRVELGAKLGNENENENENDPPYPPPNGGRCVSPASLRIPPEVAARAEQLVGRPLSTTEQALLTRFVHSDQHPVAWILEALEDAESAGIRRVQYAKGILERYRDEGGPRQPGAASARGQPRAPDPPVPPTRAKYPTTAAT